MSDNIIPASGLDFFHPAPDYAIDALWLEWQRMRRENPPDNIICTSGSGFQKFCQTIDDTRCIFPSTFTSRETLLDLTMLPAASYYKEEVQRLHNILSQWDEADEEVYIAFIYEGSEYRHLFDAVIKKLQPKYNQIKEQYALP